MATQTKIIRLVDARVGDVIIEDRPLIRRRTGRSPIEFLGTSRERWIVVEAASRENRFKVIVSREGSSERFAFDTQFIQIETINHQQEHTS